MIGTIVRNKSTANHAEWLRNKGYIVEEGTITKKKKDKSTYKATAFLVQVTRFRTGLFNFETEEEASAFFKDTVAKQEALTYATQLHLPGEERPHKGIWLAKKLGPVSALIMSPQREETTKPHNKYDW